MSRLIDADALRESIITRQTEMSYEDAWALTCVDNAPTIEPQPKIIRCKNCKWWERLHSRCDLFQMYQKEEWYCANAELREEQHD